MCIGAGSVYCCLGCAPSSIIPASTVQLGSVVSAEGHASGAGSGEGVDPPEVCSTHVCSNILWVGGMVGGCVQGGIGLVGRGAEG